MEFYKILIAIFIISSVLVFWNWLLGQLIRGIAFFWTSSWLILCISSLVGFTLTKGISVMAPMLLVCLLSLFYFKPKVENPTQNKHQIAFFLTSLVFYQLLYWIFFTFFTVNGMNFLHRDYQFYVNKAATISIIGVENVNATIFHALPDSPEMYHYFDLYVYWFFTLFKSFFNLDELVIGVIFPLFAALLTTNLYAIIQKIYPKHAESIPSAIMVAILPLIIPIYDIFYGWEYIRNLSFSLFNHPKLLFIGFLLSLLFFVYYSANRVWLYTFGIVFGSIFTTLIPYVFGFLALVFFIDIIQKKFIVKQLVLPFIFGVISVSWMYFLYGDSTLINVHITERPIDFQSNLLRRLAIIRDSSVIIFVYIPFVLMVYITHKFKWNFRITKDEWLRLLPPIVSIVFGIAAWTIFHFRFSDANQFFYGVYPVVVPFFILLIIFRNFDRINIITTIFFLIVTFWINTKDRINFLDGNTRFQRVDSLEEMYISSSDFKRFVSFFKGYETDKFFFLNDDPSLLGTDYRHPAYFFYKIKYPFHCFNLSLPSIITEKQKVLLELHPLVKFKKINPKSKNSIELDFMYHHGVTILMSRNYNKLKQIIKNTPHQTIHLKSINLYIAKVYNADK